MAQVDFSNAVLEPANGLKPITVGYNLMLAYDGGLFNSGGSSIVTSNSLSKLVNNPNKVTMLFAGKFTASGTEFYLGNNGSNRFWKVSNISFSSGDTYSFAIDIETSITS